MLKRYEGVIQGKPVQITKLSAEPALSVHAELTSLLSGSLVGLADHIGSTDEQQMAAFGVAIQNAFADSGGDKFVNFIKKALVTGNVIVDGQRVNHLDDFERFEDIDGSIFMYETFAEWLKLNLGSLLKKAMGLIG